MSMEFPTEIPVDCRCSKDDCIGIVIARSLFLTVLFKRMISFTVLITLVGIELCPVISNHFSNRSDMAVFFICFVKEIITDAGDM